MRTVLATAAGVIGNSQATLDDLASFGRREMLPEPPGIAAWLGTTSLPTSAQSAVERPTFVTLGTIEARKNHLLLLRVWARLVEKLGSSAPRLLVIGQRGWEADEAIDLLDGQAFGDAVVEIGGCYDVELARHLSSARALLFPSLAEGFGMPLMEAFDSGVPAIVSDLVVFREIGRGIPELLDPRDEDSWERAILDYASDNSMARKEQLNRLASFSAPTWEDHFASVGSWLKAL